MQVEAHKHEKGQLKAQVENLAECKEALLASFNSQQAVVSELKAEVQTLRDTLEGAAQREATRFEEGQEALRASLNAQTAAVVAQQAWLRALAPQAGGISGLQGSDLNSWTLVAQSQHGEHSSLAGVSASGISIESTGPRCFLKDAIFQTPAGYGEAGHLHAGAQVYAENGSVLTVTAEPETRLAHCTVNLETAIARLRVTPDHRIVLPDGTTAAWQDWWLLDLAMSRYVMNVLLSVP